MICKQIPRRVTEFSLEFNKEQNVCFFFKVHLNLSKLFCGWHLNIKLGLLCRGKKNSRINRQRARASPLFWSSGMYSSRKWLSLLQLRAGSWRRKSLAACVMPLDDGCFRDPKLRTPAVEEAQTRPSGRLPAGSEAERGECSRCRCCTRGKRAAARFACVKVKRGKKRWQLTAASQFSELSRPFGA